MFDIDSGEAPALQLCHCYFSLKSIIFVNHLHKNFYKVQKKLDDVFSSINLKDICNCYNIRNVQLLKSVIAFFISNIGNTFSSASMIKCLKNERR